ncbi:Sua5/YciO/YrdC/YwlC family protein [Alloprevotella rava F0323]|uniref:L-threonylcarbamoyladenylate synthase n=1 Tax=Alloprevotella rava F0323 TaxID=679199 RepID=G5G9Y2_9BACT|nr:Sua5/YciO/YrdC/YwlC family protein [Alloprevotella rava F0323]
MTSMSNKKFQKKTSEERVLPERPKPLPREWQEDIRQAVEVMNRGGIILYPTDTIWGLGCDATNEEAVKKIYEIKRRTDSKALITLVDSEAKVQFYVREVPNVAWDIIELSTKPTTIIYDEARNLATNLLAEDGSVGIRITNEPFSKQLCFRMKRAIVSTSANISGDPSPHKFRDIPNEILEAVDYICTSRRGEKGNPPASSIIKLGAGGLVEVIRR